MTNTIKWANESNDVEVEHGKLISRESITKFLLSLGRTEEEITQEYESNNVYRFQYKDQIAISGASHWQFLTKKSIIQKFLPFDMSRPMGQVNRLDKHMNELGYLRLMTPEELVDNLSNSLDENTMEKIKAGKQKPKKLIHRILDFSIIKSILLFIHHRIFLAYFDR